MRVWIHSITITLAIEHKAPGDSARSRITLRREAIDLQCSLSELECSGQASWMDSQRLAGNARQLVKPLCVTVLESMQASDRAAPQPDEPTILFGAKRCGRPMTT